MQHREFGRPVINTETVRKMDRNELERALIDAGAEWDNDDPDDRLRDNLMIAIAPGDSGP